MSVPRSTAGSPASTSNGSAREVSSCPAPNRPWIDERLCAPWIHRFRARNSNAGERRSAPSTASSVPNSAAVSTPLRTVSSARAAACSCAVGSGRHVLSLRCGRLPRRQCRRGRCRAPELGGVPFHCIAATLRSVPARQLRSAAGDNRSMDAQTERTTRIHLCGRLHVEWAGKRIERDLPGRRGAAAVLLPGAEPPSSGSSRRTRRRALGGRRRPSPGPTLLATPLSRLAQGARARPRSRAASQLTLVLPADAVIDWEAVGDRPLARASAAINADDPATGIDSRTYSS